MDQAGRRLNRKLSVGGVLFRFFRIAHRRDGFACHAPAILASKGMAAASSNRETWTARPAPLEFRAPPGPAAIARRYGGCQGHPGFHGAGTPSRTAESPNINQNRASRLGKIRPNLKRFSLCERTFGQAAVIPFPPHVLCLPDLPVPKHCAHQDTRSSEPHLGHRLLSFATLLIAVAPLPFRIGISARRTSKYVSCLTQERNEITPFHVCPLRPRSHPTTWELCCASQQIWVPIGSFGSWRDKTRPEQLLSAALSRPDDLLHRNILLLRATCGLLQCSKAGRSEWFGKLLDHFVSGGEQRRRHGEAEHPGGRGIDYQLKLARLNNRQVRWLGPP
jgi:hypothetical protein